MSTAAKVAEHKRKHPELYCPTDRCLWRTNGGYCPRHGTGAVRTLNTIRSTEKHDAQVSS